MDATRAAAGGLEGVVVAETQHSEVDGERGRLIVAGRDIEDLAGSAPFEEACALLWGTARERVGAALGEAREGQRPRLGSLGDALDREDGMDALRAAKVEAFIP